MRNLLKETKAAIKESGHKISDVSFIGSQDTGHQCSWKEFQVLADIEYSSGFGGQNIANDLIVVFSDGIYMVRGEYDGSEWWEYNKPFVMPAEKKSIKTLFNGDCWATVEEMQKVGGKYS